MRSISLALLIALAACGSEQQNAAGPDAAPSAAAGTPATTAPASADAPVAKAIPARFHGVWDAETGTCDPASDLRVAIAATTIGFYESMGSVTAVTAAPDDAALIDLAMEGEGDQWTTAMTLSLSGDGAERRLKVMHKGEGGPEPLTLKPCPA